MKRFILLALLLLPCCKPENTNNTKDFQQKDTTKTTEDTVRIPTNNTDITTKIVCDTLKSVISVCKLDTCKNKKEFSAFLSGSCAPACSKINKSLLSDLKYLQKQTGVRFKITSSGRTKTCNLAVGGAANSSHLNIPIMAMDIQAVTASGQFYAKKHKSLAKQIQNKGAILDVLLKRGYCGFGIYERHIHLDKDNSKGGNNKHKGYNYRIWVVSGSAVSVGC